MPPTVKIYFLPFGVPPFSKDMKPTHPDKSRLSGRSYYDVSKGVNKIFLIV